ncbi:MAG TPA: hypothetical protein VNE61_01990 [Ktedonobacteraceae bacterium]|nr:hypothetical protein [Ktedonobacteraceae bacterium]
MIRRVLAPLLVIIFVLAALVLIALLIMHGGGVVRALQSGQDIVSLILTLLQLLGIFLIFVLLLYILVQYIQYTRSHRFIFDGFSNASKLIDAANMPIELTMLAREKLIYQVKVLYSQWKTFSRDGKPDADALLTDELYSGQPHFAQDLARYISSEMSGDNEAAEYLRRVIKTLMDSEGINLMDLAGEIAPKEVTPIMKFIEAVVPPRAVRATGHLQWWSEKAKGAGITFEFVDLGSRRNIMVRTIWYTLKEEQEDQKQTPLSGEDEKSLAAEHYIELLEPTMRWLALMFWEQRMKAHNTSFVKYFFDARGKKRQAARLLYLFGSLYNASANQFSVYKDFFCQLAVEHFRQATIADENWYSPYLYLGNLYSFKMREETKDELRNKLLDEAIKLFEAAMKKAKRANEGSATEKRITLAQALTELVSDISTGNEKHIKEVVIQKVKRIKEDSIDSASFDFKRADCAAFLYNLASWYGLAHLNRVSIPDVNTRDEARRYLAYSLALSENLRERIEYEDDSQLLYEAVDLGTFREELAKHKNLTEKAERVKMTWVAFKAEIDEMLKRVDERWK